MLLGQETARRRQSESAFGRRRRKVSRDPIQRRFCFAEQRCFASASASSRAAFPLSGGMGSGYVIRSPRPAQRPDHLNVAYPPPSETGRRWAKICRWAGTTPLWVRNRPRFGETLLIQTPRNFAGGSSTSRKVHGRQRSHQYCVDRMGQMRESKPKEIVSAPEVSEQQLAEIRARLPVARREPLFSPGSTSKCPNCGGRMVTTNDLERTLATPGLVYVIPRLPGARCLDCGSSELDGLGAAIVETSAPRRIVADYETDVTRPRGGTPGTYFDRDLARGMGLSGDERLCWAVVDRDTALVRIERRKARARTRAKTHPGNNRR